MQTETTTTTEPVHFALVGTTACGRAVYERRMRTTRHLLWDEVTCERCLEPGRRQRMEAFARNDIENDGELSRVAILRAAGRAAKAVA